MSEYRPLPPAIRRVNEAAQILSSISLILSLAVVGFLFFFGSEDTAGYRFDGKHGWAYLGDRSEPERYEFRLLANDEAARIDKGVLVQKREGNVYLRPEPYYPFYAVLGTWLGFDRDSGVKSIVPSGSCARVNAITKTGLNSLWIHITIVDDAQCGGPRPDPAPNSDAPDSEAPDSDAPATAPATEEQQKPDEPAAPQADAPAAAPAP